jgi:LytS/YehU family sensor histidine kinase
MFSERLAGVTITMGLGIGVGCVVVAAVLLREKHARDQARILRAEAERHQLEKNVLEARLALMQAQVEPHFLFNTLANVQHLVETDPPAAARVLESLIRYLRAALPQMRESSTNLGRELDMARAYLEIHQVRMGSRLEFAIEVPEPLKSRAFPPMMLISLVENAVKHGVDPCCDCGRIVIRARESDGNLRVSVEDTGEGLSPEAVRRMFDRFWRGDSSRRGEGAGLGLAIARGLVESQGGRIWAEPRSGGGARVSFTLPAA